MGLKWYLILHLHLSTCLLTICMFSLEKCLIHTPGLFVFWFGCLLVVKFNDFLVDVGYKSIIRHTTYKYFLIILIIFSTFFMVSFKAQTFLILIKFNLSFFFLSSRAFGVIAKKSLLNSGPIYWIFFSLEYFYSISRWPWNRCNLLENRLVIAPGSDSESQICRSGRPRLCVCIWRWR